MNPRGAEAGRPAKSDAHGRSADLGVAARRLIAFLRWDWANQSRQNMVAATVFSTAALCLLATLAPSRPLAPALTTLLLLADPAAVGLGFVGAAIFLERSAGVIAALGASPSPRWVYIAAKAVLFGVIGTVSGLLVAGLATALWAETGLAGAALTAAGLALANVAAVLLGVGLAAGAPSMNAFLLRVAVATLPLAAPPILLLSGGLESFAAPLWAIPSTPATYLLAVGAGAEGSLIGLAAALTLSLVWIALAWRYAAKGLRRLLEGETNR